MQTLFQQNKKTFKPSQITLWLRFLHHCCPIYLLRASKRPVTSSLFLFATPRHSQIHSSSNWNVQIWIFKIPFYPLYTCSLIKYSTFSHYCIRRSMNGKHNRTTVIHNPLILSMTAWQDKRWILEVIYKPRDRDLLLYKVARFGSRLYTTFKYSLIIHEENTKKISTMSETLYVIKFCSKFLLDFYG